MSQAGPLNSSGGDVPSDVPIDFVTDSGTARAFLYTLNVLGSGSTTTSGSGNTITINSTGGSSFTWNVVTSADNPVNLTASNGYICKGAGAVNFVLPAAASIGNVYKIVGYGNLWTVAQNAGQSITIGFLTSTPGVGGSINATMISDSIELVCVTTNLEFYEVSIQGNITVV